MRRFSWCGVGRVSTFSAMCQRREPACVPDLLLDRRVVRRTGKHGAGRARGSLRDLRRSLPGSVEHEGEQRDDQRDHREQHRPEPCVQSRDVQACSCRGRAHTRTSTRQRRGGVVAIQQIRRRHDDGAGQHHRRYQREDDKHARSTSAPCLVLSSSLHGSQQHDGTDAGDDEHRRSVENQGQVMVPTTCCRAEQQDADGDAGCSHDVAALPDDEATSERGESEADTESHQNRGQLRHAKDFGWHGGRGEARRVPPQGEHTQLEKECRRGRRHQHRR